MRNRASNFISVQKKGFLSKRNHVLINQTVLILLTCSTLLFVYTKYSLSKTIQLYLEKPIRDISINEFRNARKAIFINILNACSPSNTISFGNDVSLQYFQFPLTFHVRLFFFRYCLLSSIIILSFFQLLN